MDTPDVAASGHQTIERILGYLNFSSGVFDPQFPAAVSQLFQSLEPSDPHLRDAATRPRVGEIDAPATWRMAVECLRDELLRLKTDSSAFRDVGQARAVLDLVADRVLPGYLDFHRDLLFHQTDATLFRPLFFARVCEVVLRQGPPWDASQGIVEASIRQLNDYIGYRPVATLETQKIEPYEHEWCRPVPLYIEGCGVSGGRYHDVVASALQMLHETDEDLLQRAFLDPDRLEELAFDPRAYDFDHPVNKRPNYHFGQWDPHRIDNRGFYRRYVVQQVTLDALMERLDDGDGVEQDELLFEAAAVLAGTILMGSGISGSGPDSHDSTVTLARLLPRIAAYRDEFYERLLDRIGGKHGRRLRDEASALRQPLGAARQHLNARLARRRAAQLEHVQLAKIYARMGYPDAAKRHADVVPTASARLLCRIDCHLTAAHQQVDCGDLGKAMKLAERIMDYLDRGIQCGAIIDPWNIIGFDAHFSLFPALENSIHDHRADDLIALMEQIFGLMSRIWSEASAVENRETCAAIGARMEKTAEWWHQFAAHEVAIVEAPDALDTLSAARHVARAMGLWYQGGAATGDVRFWAQHAELFDSPKAYALVIEALLDRQDFISSMALLTSWLECGERIGLEKGDCSFHRLAQRWMRALWERTTEESANARDSVETDVSGALDAERCWALSSRFLEFLEANAESYWNVPDFDPENTARNGTENGKQAADAMSRLFEGDEEEDESENPFSAAYESVIYRDSTDDGFDGNVFDPSQPSEDQLQAESKRIVNHLAFLDGLARLWKQVAVGVARQSVPAEKCRAMMEQWYTQAAINRLQLIELGEAVHRRRIPRPSGGHDSMVQYDRQRMLKEMLLDRIISTCVDTADAARFILAALATQSESTPSEPALPDTTTLAGEEQRAIGLCACVFRTDADAVVSRWDGFLKSLEGKPLLYVPLSKGGDPNAIASVRIRQRIIRDLLAWLPRLGLLVETGQLVETARGMEREQSPGPGAVTEFDELFETGYRSVVCALVAASEDDGKTRTGSSPVDREPELVEHLERATRTLLMSWLAHSRALWLSVMERVKDGAYWRRVVKFIRRYGGDLFTQHFLNIGNLRAILHQGVDTWLRHLEENDYDERPKFVDQLDRKLPRHQAVDCLTIILQAIVENYSEYIDYNSTTTQSDNGELLYMLLDFLRLRNEYDRVAWHLKPVVLAHEILLRHGHDGAAESWRDELARQIGGEADRYLRRLARLQKKYAMRMRTVADRLNEKFTRPLTIDRIRSLVAPAIREATQPGSSAAFEMLEYEVEQLTREPSGTGFDIPEWIEALAEEVDRVRGQSDDEEDVFPIEDVIPRRILTVHDIHQQLALLEQYATDAASRAGKT
jgi:hypothetical protein